MIEITKIPTSIMMQEHRQQARVAGQLSAFESFRNLKRWRFLQIFWELIEKLKKIKRLGAE
jgi:hypothetical protein